MGPLFLPITTAFLLGLPMVGHRERGAACSGRCMHGAHVWCAGLCLPSRAPTMHGAHTCSGQSGTQGPHGCAHWELGLCDCWQSGHIRRSCCWEPARCTLRCAQCLHANVLRVRDTPGDSRAGAQHTSPSVYEHSHYSPGCAGGLTPSAMPRAPRPFSQLLGGCGVARLCPHLSPLAG